MGRRARPWLALAGSLLLHASLLGGLAWTLPAAWQLSSEPAVFEARLAPAPHPTPLEPPPVPRRSPPPAEPTQPAESREATVEVVAEAPLEATTDTDAIAAIPAEAAVVDAAVALQPPGEDVPPPLNSLPPRLDLRYQVRYGIAAGEQTLVWISEGDRYTLTSVAGATGLTGVFYRGRFVQTSRGRITPQGLQPEEFWDQRGDRHSSARFDAQAGRITLTPHKGAPRHFAYAGNVQDALSLFFQLALTAPPATQFSYRVFNGKKLRDYAYEARGEEMLDTPLGALRTLHVTRAAGDDGRFEAWLAVDRHYLPVRVVRSDDKGNAIELQLQSIAP